LSNAIKFCAETGGKISIAIEENVEHIAVTIHNNGKTIKSKMLSQYFINQETKISKNQ
jgi:signal transduction histidine kinase